MEFWRRMPRISRTEYVSNAEVIKIEALNSFIHGSRKRKLKYM